MFTRGATLCTCLFLAAFAAAAPKADEDDGHRDLADRLFVSADKNKDKTLDAAEIAEARRLLLVGMKAALKGAEKKVRTGPPVKALAPDELTALVDKTPLDADASGKVSAEELRQYVAQVYEPVDEIVAASKPAPTVPAPMPPPAALPVALPPPQAFPSQPLAGIRVGDGNDLRRNELLRQRELLRLREAELQRREQETREQAQAKSRQEALRREQEAAARAAQERAEREARERAELERRLKEERERREREERARKVLPQKVNKK